LDLVVRSIDSVREQWHWVSFHPSPSTTATRGTNAPNPHPLLDIRWRNTVSQPNDKLCDLLEVDDILVLFVGVGLLALREDGQGRCVWSSREADDLGAPSDLQRVLFAHALLVGGKIPQVRRSESSVRFLDA
jgi:hypothetical protein